MIRIGQLQLLFEALVLGYQFFDLFKLLPDDYPTLVQLGPITLPHRQMLHNLNWIIMHTQITLEILAIPSIYPDLSFAYTFLLMSRVVLLVDVVYYILIMLRLVLSPRFFSSVRDRIKQQRETRLGKASESVLPTRTAQSLAMIRNIGIIAHIDAGKTTTTQRMLYYAGALPSPGDIDEGTTTMDYMRQERERGITIRSAAISFNWNKYQINLIDTPGHVDFSGEVARSLRVLDGAVTILDGVKGVEAQTMKVWELATKKNIPKLCFINKMDRIGSSIVRTAQAIEGLLKVDPIIFQAQLGQGQNFRGVVDLLTMNQYEFKGKYGEQQETTIIKKDHPLFDEMQKKRQLLIERIANYDEQVGDMFLNQMPINVSALKAAVRRMLNNPEIQGKICPIFIGAAYKNKGIQPLLDAIVDYLPSPTQRPPVFSSIQPQIKRQPIKSERFAAYTFKVICDRELGPLAYARIYSGQLKKGSNIYNSSRGIIEKMSNIYRVRANQYIPVADISAGDIVAISGLKETRAGETLTETGDSQFVLDKLELPSAIFTMPIQLKSKSKQNEFLQAMQKVVLQDNSLQFKEQHQTGQYLVSGLGQLHLQIVKDKLIEQGIDVKLGSLKISFRETVRDLLRKSLKLRNQLKSGNYQQFELQLQIAPLRYEDQSIEDTVNVVFDFPKVEGFDANWREFLNRKQISRTGRREEEDTKDLAVRNTVKKSARNPTPIEPLVQEDQQDIQELSKAYMQDAKDQQQSQSEQNQEKAEQVQPYYHINTLPFDTLFELFEICKVSMLSGANNYPMMGVQLRIKFGKFQKKHFSKTIMNKTASQLIRQLISNSAVVQPFLEFQLQGQPNMIDEVSKDVLRRRGRIDNQEPTKIDGMIPAASIKGWIKQLRVMGLNVQMKFSHYEQIVGVDPKKLLQENR